MELWRLRYFVVVAEEEHVGRAASRLHVSQSPLSRQIRQLETDLGLELFAREGRGVRLTAAGREALTLARELLAHAGRTEAQLRALGAGEAGPVRIGYVQGATYNGVLPSTLARLRARVPKVEPRLVAMRSHEQLSAILDDILDVGFVHTAASENGLICRRLCNEPFVLVVAADGADGNSKITPRALTSLPWITPPRTSAPGFHARFEAAAARLGFKPRIVLETIDIPAALSFVSRGFGVALVQESIALALPPGVVAHAIPQLGMRIETFAIWRDGTSNPAASRLIEALPAQV